MNSGVAAMIKRHPRASIAFNFNTFSRKEVWKTAFSLESQRRLYVKLDQKYFG